MDRQSLERITYSHYDARYNWHVYDVSGTAVFISDRDIWAMPNGVGDRSLLGDELLRRAKVQRAKGRKGVCVGIDPARPGEDRIAMAVSRDADTTGAPPGDNFVKLGQIADELVKGLAPKRPVEAGSRHVGNVTFNSVTVSSGDGKPLLATAHPQVQVKEFPSPALDHRHMHGGLFISRRTT